MTSQIPCPPLRPLGAYPDRARAGARTDRHEIFCVGMRDRRGIRREVDATDEDPEPRTRGYRSPGPEASSRGGINKMHFQVRTDNHIENSEALIDGIRGEVENALMERFADRIRRVEVYLQDMNSHKSGIDTRCSIEISLKGHQPVA